MEFLLIALLVVWLVSPLGLIPAVAVLAVKNSKLRKMISGPDGDRELKDGRRERKPVSFTAILVTGVILVITAGIVFATTGWEYMNGIARTALILSMSAVFFTAGVVSEKKFGLDRTGFAFWFLGGLFLPVSVIGIAYFELLGSAFSFNDECAYLVFLVMLIVTLAVIAVSEYRYSSSKITRYVFGTVAAAEYITFVLALNDVLTGFAYDDIMTAVILLTAGYLLFVLTPALRTVPAQSGFIAVFAVFASDPEGVRGAVAAAVCGLVCVLISLAVNKKIYSAVSIAAFPVLTALLTADIIFRADPETGDFGITLRCISVLAAASFVFGLSVLRKIPSPVRLFVSEQEADRRREYVKLHWLERVSALAVMFLAFVGFDSADRYYPEYWYAFGFSVAAFFALKSLVLNIQKRETDRNHALMFMFILTAFTLMYTEVPEIIEAEFLAAASLVATVPLLFIWKKHRVISEMTVFVHAVVILLYLGVNALDSGELISAVIFAGICTLMTVFSFMRRSKKWFILSTLALLASVLYFTSEVFEFVSWWVFLLLIGLIFIVYAASNEYCRQTGRENPFRNMMKIADKIWK